MNRQIDFKDPNHAAGWAALYVAGAMESEELCAYEAHLSEGCKACEEELNELAPIADRLLESVVPEVPPADIKKRLMTQIEQKNMPEHVHDHATDKVDGTNISESRPWLQWPDNSDAPFFISKASEARWEDTGATGVQVRKLSVDRKRDQFTALVRMAPGASYPCHTHATAEECVVLEGDLHVGEEVMRAGDYQRAPAGSEHGVQYTEGGCVLLIVSSLSDEMH